MLRAGALGATLLFLSACAVPLGPGYTIEQQQLEVRHVAASPPQVRVRATYRMKNTGDRELPFLDVNLPDEQSSGRRNLRVWVDEREVSPQPLGDAADGVRVSLDRWPQKQRLSLAVEYELAPGPPARRNLAVSEDMFYLLDPGVFPALRAPQGIFTEGGVPPEGYRLLVQVPLDFRVFAAGREQGSRRQAGEAEYRFRLSKQEFRPFVVAGRYLEQKANSGGTVFWTMRQLDAQHFQAAGARLAATFQVYRGAFGPIWKHPPPVRVVEAPAPLVGDSPGSGDAAGIAVLTGALLTDSAFARGVSSDDFLHLAEHVLAHTWFGLTTMPQPETQPVLGEGLAEYATVVAAEARSGQAERQRQAARLLRWFDESRKEAADKPLLQLRPEDPPEQHAFGYSKGGLLFLALEDRYGAAKVRGALTHLVSSMRGRHFGFSELIAALEIETREPAGEFFRLWLDQSGIPAEVRARYEAAQGSSPGGESR